MNLIGHNFYFNPFVFDVENDINTIYHIETLNIIA